MSKRIYVGNLPFSTTSDELATFFSDFGSVKKVHLASSSSKEPSFVDLGIDKSEYSNMDDWLLVIKNLKFKGVNLEVSWKGGGGGGGRQHGW